MTNQFVGMASVKLNSDPNNKTQVTKRAVTKTYIDTRTKRLQKLALRTKYEQYGLSITLNLP